MPKDLTALSVLNRVQRNWDYSPEVDQYPIGPVSEHVEYLTKENTKRIPKKFKDFNFDLRGVYPGDLGASTMSPVGRLNFSEDSPFGRSFEASSPVPLSPLLQELESFGRQRIEMSRPVEGCKLGLAVADLEVQAVLKPESEAYGWRVGDKIIAVNGTPVHDQDQFDREWHKAVVAYFNHLTPLVFDVRRGDFIPDVSRLG